MIIYYKQISEGYEDQKRFEIMQKVGLSRREVRSSVRRQILMVFFLPLLMAMLHITMAFPMIRRMLLLFGMTNTKLFIGCTAGTTFAHVTKRIQRYSIILEHLISPEGAFPVFGRSITYRTGVLQPLALIVWKGLLPEELSNGQVRTAMTAVIKRMFADGQNFNEKGFLTLGFNGKQPHSKNIG